MHKMLGLLLHLALLTSLTLFPDTAVGLPVSSLQAGAETQTANPATPSSEVEIAKPQKWKHIKIELKNNGRPFTGRVNHFCVVFSTPEVHDVRVNFRQLVGKIEEPAIPAVLEDQGSGRFCGTVDLGHLWRDPSTYYVIVHLTNDKMQSGKVTFDVIARRKSTLHLN